MRRLTVLIMGNGDLGVAVIGNINAPRFVLNKNEFWSLNQDVQQASVN
jgi:hypothetical protein